jgi:hypothetical protein
VAVHRAVNQRMYAEIPALLELGLALRLESTPCAHQAAELLSRLANYGEILRSRRSSASSSAPPSQDPEPLDGTNTGLFDRQL